MQPTGLFEPPSFGAYRVTAKLGEGSFGTVFQCEKDGHNYAIKTEDARCIKMMLLLEYQILSALKGSCFPKVFEFVELQQCSYLVMDQLQCSLQEMVNKQLHNQIAKDVFLRVMHLTLKPLEELHRHGYLYRDVKPTNYMLSATGICLIDFGLAKKYWVGGRHIGPREGKKMVGTPLFCSLNAHHGLELSRRDDLLAWLYMCIYLLRKLPWEVYANKLDKAEDKKEVYDKIAKCKMTHSFSQLVSNKEMFPNCLGSVCEIIAELQFAEEPRYELIYECINDQYRQLVGKNLFDSPFSWKSQIKIKEVKKVKINFKAPESKKPKSINSLQIPPLEANNDP